jgi:hypothetical protein
MSRSTRIGVAGTALAHFTLNTARALALGLLVASPSGRAKACPSPTRRKCHAVLRVTSVVESPEGGL